MHLYAIQLTNIQQPLIAMPSNVDIKLGQAVIAFRAGQYPSIRKCAEAFDVNHATLARRIRGQRSRRTAHEEQQLLSSEQEESIVRWILELEVTGNAINHAQLRAMVLLICRVSGGSTRLGRHWIYRFIHRHPEIATKIGRKIDHERVQAVTPDIVQAFFTQVAATVSNYQVKVRNIWNMDETGTALGVCTNQTVLGSASTRSTYVQRPENREWASTIEAISADGRKVRSTTIFKAKSVQTTWFMPNDIPDALYTTSEKGWTSNEIGLRWLDQVFLPESKDSNEYRILILDGHGSHATIEFMWKCYQNRVLLIYLPAHSSHVLQPLDLTCFSPLKSSYRRQIAELASLEDSAPIKKIRFIQYYARAREDGLTERNIRSGFAAAGIVPFNPNKVLSSSQVQRSIQPPRTPSNARQTALLTATSPSLPTPRNQQQVRRSLNVIQEEEDISRNVRRLLFSMGKQLDRFTTQLAQQSQQIDHQARVINEQRQRSSKRQAIDLNRTFKDIVSIKAAQDKVQAQMQAWQRHDRLAEARNLSNLMQRSDQRQFELQFHACEGIDVVVVDN
jgi:hypothetical protein